ncbi:unnamed protein product, partial [marine sediment metagenome]
LADMTVHPGPSYMKIPSGSSRIMTHTEAIDIVTIVMTSRAHTFRYVRPSALKPATNQACQSNQGTSAVYWIALLSERREYHAKCEEPLRGVAIVSHPYA